MLNNILYEYEAFIRLSSFLSLFVIIALLELFVPRRQQIYPKAVRWVNNLAITTFNVTVTRWFLPIAAVATAAVAEQNNLGLFYQLSLPTWLSICIALLVFDITIYFQHRIFHQVPYLWRLHRMHHADLDFDVSTGIRFHPIEIILSMVIKSAVVLLIGAPIVAVILFEVLLNATSLFNHANIYIPKKIDKFLRLFIVTPDMHRVHHSVLKNETDSNFCFNVPWWDYLFKTYKAQPEQGHQKMKIGLEQFRNTRELWLDRLLLQPFKNVPN